MESSIRLSVERLSPAHLGQFDIFDMLIKKIN